MSHLDNTHVSKHLGQVSKYASNYDPSLLVREPRSSNRTHLNIADERLPFTGYDVWNAYEISMLNCNGLPVTGVAKILYSASSKYIVESKSLKLYLNSFNMSISTRVTPAEVYEDIESRVTGDLSKLLETDTVMVKIFSASPDYNTTANLNIISDINEYLTLEKYSSLKNIKCSQYSESPDLLSGRDHGNTAETIQKFHSSLLKSNCRVTNQPDWGDVYIHYRGNYTLDPESLLKYVVSFRDECHFHEEICETIYKRLHDKFSPRELMVTCLYVRRGGIDINPIRASSQGLIYPTFFIRGLPFAKTLRQ